MSNDKKYLEKYLKDHKDKPYIMWEKFWLLEFMTLDVCDQKVLAVLYWEELTDEQKNVFDEVAYMEHEKYAFKKKQEIMQDPTKMRQHFLEGAAPILDTMIALGTGSQKKITGQDEWAIREVWEVLKAIITTANDPAPLVNLKGKAIEDQINEILTAVSEQKMTITDAKEYMSLVSSGFNLQQLPKLLAKLDQLEGK